MLALTLSACSGDKSQSAATTPPQASAVGEKVAPVDIPTVPGSPVESIETVAPIPTPMETFRALAPAEGLKITPLFNTPIRDSDERLKRLETAVQGIRNDFDTIMPTMVRNAGMEKNIRELIDRLNALNGLDSNAETTDPQPSVLPPDLPPLNQADLTSDAEQTDEDCLLDEYCEMETPEQSETTATGAPTALAAVEAPATPTAEMVGDIKALRIGDHPDMTRLVLDMTVKAELVASLQNDDKQLVIDLPKLNWTAKTQDALRGAKLVSAYKYENGKLILDMLRPAKIKEQHTLPAEHGAGSRYVIDLVVKP